MPIPRRCWRAPADAGLDRVQVAGHGIDVRIMADGGGGDVERRQIGPAERAFGHLRGRDGNDALDLTIRREAG